MPLLGKGFFFIDNKQVFTVMFRSLGLTRNGLEFKHLSCRRSAKGSSKHCEWIIHTDTKVLNLKGTTKISPPSLMEFLD